MTGWVLYLEGSTDLAILQAFASRLQHEEAIAVLARPYVYYVGNRLLKAESHYYGLKEALPNLKGIVILDEMTGGQSERALVCDTWRKREIENYFCTRTTLEAFARASVEEDNLGPLFEPSEIERRAEAMSEAIKKG